MKLLVKVSHSVLIMYNIVSYIQTDFFYLRFLCYRINIIFSQWQAFAAYWPASSGPVENVLPIMLLSKNIILYNIIGVTKEVLILVLLLFIFIVLLTLMLLLTLAWLV